LDIRSMRSLVFMGCGALRTRWDNTSIWKVPLW